MRSNKLEVMESTGILMLSWEEEEEKSVQFILSLMLDLVVSGRPSRLMKSSIEKSVIKGASKLNAAGPNAGIISMLLQSSA